MGYFCYRYTAIHFKDIPVSAPKVTGSRSSLEGDNDDNNDENDIDNEDKDN